MTTERRDMSLDGEQSELRQRRLVPVVQRILDDQKYFEDTYKEAGGSAAALQRKYDLACSLIEDGRYINRRFLVERLIPQDVDLDSTTLELAENLKGQLTLQLIKTGDISTVSPDAEAAEKVIADKFNHNQPMLDLAQAGVPVYVVSQIMTLEECTGMTDEKKLEEFRSWTIHSILGPYLGQLKGRRPEREFTVVDLMDRIPKQVFTNPYAVRYNLIANYFAGQLRQRINELGSEAGIADIEASIEQITDPERKEFLQGIYEDVYDSVTYPYRGDFRSAIQVKGQPRIFPCAEQAAFCHDFIRYDTRLCVADPGLGKTGTGYFTVENTGAEQVLVVAPAEVRPVWREQDGVVFRNPGSVFIIETSDDIEPALVSPNKYVVVSRELLGRTESDPELLPKLLHMVAQRRVDGAIIDEIHNFVNPDAASTRALLRILEVIHQNYRDKTGKEVAPVIGLTATPIRGEIADLNVPMAMLYPGEFAVTPADATETKKTFSDRCLRNPYLTYIALTGERRMFRWESGSHEFDYDTLQIQASPFEKLLADFIYTEVGIDALNKIRLIENALFNPLLVKHEVLLLAKGKIPEVDIDEAIDTLRKSLAEWKKLRGIAVPESDADYLSTDRLVELGLGRVVLGCFFSGLPNGIDSLVEELLQDTADDDWADLKAFWKFRGISTKYDVLRQQLEQSLAWRVCENGSLGREKVIIISPSRKQGRTGDVLQREVKDGNGSTTKLYGKADLDRINDTKLISLIKDWVKEKGLCDPEDVLLIDGSVHVGPKRDAVISRFANDPKAAVLVLTLEAAYQGRDFTLNNVADNLGRIIGIHNISLGPTWDSRQIWQMIGRSVRQGRLVPVRSTVMEIMDSVEQGKGEVVRFTGLLDRIVLSGATLHPADQEFFDSKKVGSRVLSYVNPEAKFLRDAFAFVKGQDPARIHEFFQSKMRGQEKTNAQLLAERFYDEGRDAYKTTGYNAEMVASLISKFGLEDGQILCLGAGTLLLQRKLRRGIDNVDYNPYMMQAGWQEAQDFGGKTIVVDVAKLDREQFPDESYDLIESGFALDWSALGDVQRNLIDSSVRVQTLSQMVRVLRKGGRLILTLPERTLDDEHLASFINTLETHFGCQVDRLHSGKSYGVSRFGATKRLGWCIVAEKVTDSNLSGLNLRGLEFCSDNKIWVSSYRDKPKDSNGVVRDYPTPDIQLRFQRYEIVNDSGLSVEVVVPDGSEGSNGKNDIVVPTGSIDTATIGDEPADHAAVLGLEFLKGDSREDFGSYRRDLLRPLMKVTGLSWTETENYGINILQDIVKRSRLPQNRIIAYSWILKEARRQPPLKKG